MASFRQYKKDLTVEAKQAIIKNGMEQCKSHELMPTLIKSMFNYDLEMEIMQGEILSMPDRMPLVFNYKDVFSNCSQTTWKVATTKLQK